MKRFVLYILCAALFCACSDDKLDIMQKYGYSLETLPLPRALADGEKVDLEFSIIREGYYADAVYKFRYFQSSSEGILTYNDNLVPMNRFQVIDSDDFILTYQAVGTDQQQLDFVFDDNFKQRVGYTIQFSGK